MGGAFSIQTSNSLECLLDALAQRIASSPLPPLGAETIIVPGQGLARWLRLGLARKHGVAASLALPFPGAFLQRLGATAPDVAFAAPDGHDVRVRDLRGKAILLGFFTTW